MIHEYNKPSLENTKMLVTHLNDLNHILAEWLSTKERLWYCDFNHCDYVC